MVASKGGDDIIRRGREVMCHPAPPLTAKPRNLQAFGGTKPGRRSPMYNLAANSTVSAYNCISEYLETKTQVSEHSILVLHSQAPSHFYDFVA